MLEWPYCKVLFVAFCGLPSFFSHEYFMLPLPLTTGEVVMVELQKSFKKCREKMAFLVGAAIAVR